MENVKYIPGDLVRTKYDIPKKVYTIESVNPNDKEFVDGKITIDGGSIITKERYHGMYNKEWIHFLEPVPLTPQILEANGWKQTRHVVENNGYQYYLYENKNNLFPEIQYYPKDDWHKDDGFSVFFGDTELLPDVHFVHQLQHLLFGLGLDNNLKI